jgi:hypothetical protein
MQSSLNLTVPLGHEFFLHHEDAIEQLLEFCPWDRPALEEDLREAIQLMVPVGCSRPLIRLGGDGDGAYLLPDDLDGIDACFSPGVADCITLERELAAQHGIPCHLCDGSVDGQGLDLDPELHHFQQRWLGSHDNDTTLSLDAWVLGSAQQGSSNLLLQMDIEGAEYSCLLAASDSVLAKFRIVVIEFHFLARLASARFLNSRFLPVLRKLERHFDCVHAHANNCCGTTQLCGIEVPNVIELSFYRSTLNQPPRQPPCLPHPLDVINVGTNPPLLLGPPWTQAPPEAADP